MDSNTYVFEGKTSTEAIEKGLKELKVSKNQVEIKILENEDKRSFFSILAPRVVKVELKIKENVVEEKVENKVKNTTSKVFKLTDEDKNNCEKNIRVFLDEFLSKLPGGKFEYTLTEKDNNICVDITGDDTGFLIGYRGEVLNSVQTVVTNIASKSTKERVRVLVNIGGYRERREKDLENLASKIASTVIKTKRDITLEPMPAYERKIIHTKLQDNSKVKTYSIGEEPYRKLVVALKK